MPTGLLVLALAAIYSGDCLLVAAEELIEGDPCSLSQAFGICRKLNECQSVMRDVQNDIAPEKICVYEHSVPIVCCPATPSTTGRPIWDSDSDNRYNDSLLNRSIVDNEYYDSNNRLTTTNSEYYGGNYGEQTTSSGHYGGSNRSTTNSEYYEERSTTTTQRNSLAEARIARRMCAEYAKSVYQRIASPVSLAGQTQYVTENVCAIANNKLIVGGTRAEPKEFPHSAAIGYKSGSSIRWDCGGTLVSELFVVTAAHCLYSSQWGYAQLVRVGDLNLRRTDDTAKPQDRRIAEKFKHPNYKRPAQYDDIALLKLDSPVTFNAYVRPACLDVKGHHPVGERVVATGWGVIEFNNDHGNEDLLKVVLPVADHDDCRRIYDGDTSKLPNGFDAQTQFCAGESNKDTCQGDSGGPIAVYSTDEECMYDVIGVTSFGAACGHVPGIYTRIFHYLPWMEGIIWPNEK